MHDFDIDAIDSRRSARHAAELVFAALRVRGTKEFADNDQGFGVVLDIADGGIRIATPQPPPERAVVDVRISLEEEIFEVVTTVRWVTKVRAGTYEVGMRFDPEDPRKLELLRSFLDSVRDS
jgi:hypothetical protein